MRAAGFLLLAAVQGCVSAGISSRPVPVPFPAVFDSANVLRFDHQGRNIRLSGVRLAGDSLSGFPPRGETPCDSCRVQYPVTVLERAEYFEKGGANMAGAVTVVSFTWLVPLILFGVLVSAYSR
ncbi:MAG TPA: hypothetical protein PLJ23_01040 [Gemmatimonadales bacterium]|jgi:hypothetical protein|nr:hypothetical protein [Gemmatimonadales bacterium]